MKIYRIGIILSAIAFVAACINFILRLAFRVALGFSVQLLCLTAIIFCGCVIGYISKKNGDKDE